YVCESASGIDRSAKPVYATGRLGMPRPGDAEWSVLQLDSDPVPGDPESFAEITRAYQELSRATREAHDLLASGGRIDVGQGKAMEAFRDLIGKLPGRLDRMAHSYSAAAEAYLRYLPSLEEAQTMSLRALDQARQAAGDQGAAQAALFSAQATLTALGLDPEAEQAAKEQVTDEVTVAQHRADDAQQAIDQAKALLGQATALRDQAARTAAETLRQLAKDAPQRSLWEKIVEAFQAFIEFLRSTVIEWITTILDVIATIASFIFPPLGAAIGMLSALIDLGTTAASGDPAAIGLAAGGLLLGLVPGGRLVGRVAKVAGKGAIKGGVKASTTQLSRVKSPTATSYGPGKVIKGAFRTAGQNLSDVRAVVTAGLRSRKPVDKNTIVGRNTWGVETRFNVGDVQARPIVNHKGQQIGVSFPRSEADNRSRQMWADARHNLSTGDHDGKLFTDGPRYQRVSAEMPEEAKGVPLGQTRKSFDFSTLEPTPWQKDPLLVMTHSNPEIVALSLTNGKVVHVPGGEFAKILHHDANFRKVLNAKPDSSIVMIACSFGADNGKVAPDFGRTMKRLGNDRQIFAATSTVWTTRANDYRGNFVNPSTDFTTVAVANKGQFRPLQDVRDVPPQHPPMRSNSDPLPDFNTWQPST
ncbi:putative T7SS-secreted protein, partial [Micromonospora gifhornensis]